jgi:hypothetical protein
MDTLGNKKQPSTCNICSKELSSKQNLKHHMNIHTGERPFQCNFSGCSAAYKHASQLSNHKAIHKPPTIKVVFEFDNFRTFIELVIKALGSECKSKVKVPSGPYTIEDCALNPILNSQIGSRLPNFNPS